MAGGSRSDAVGERNYSCVISWQLSSDNCIYNRLNEVRQFEMFASLISLHW